MIGIAWWLHSAAKRVEVPTEVIVENFGIGVRMASQTIVHDLAEFFVGQKDSTVTRTGRILLTRDRAVFDLPLPTRPMADPSRVLVPPIEGFSIEQDLQTFLSGCEISKRPQRRSYG